MPARAGWSQIDITPPLDLPLGGRGPRFSPGQKVLDPLVGQVLILEDEQAQRFLWVSLDLIGLSYRSGAHLRYNLAAIAGIPYTHVLVNFSHTHSGPMTNFDKYSARVEAPPALLDYDRALHDRILRAAVQALDHLHPVAIHSYRGHSHIGINRRNRDARGAMGMRPNADGAYNRELWVLDIRGTHTRALVFNHGCHPVLVYGFAWNAISADFPGVCRRHLNQALGATTHCQFIQGLAGNVRPRCVAELAENRFRRSTPKDVEHTGRQLARDIEDALSQPAEPVHLALQGVTGHFMARRDPDQIPSLVHFRQLAASDEELQRNLGQYWTARLESGLPPVQAMPWDIGLLQLSSDQRIAFFGGEIVAEWLDHLRTWCQDQRLLVWGYCQDVPCYLPTDELIPEGGYEVVASNLYGKEGPGPFAPGLNKAARVGFEALIRRLG